MGVEMGFSATAQGSITMPPAEESEDEAHEEGNTEE
jgi:hypothetical protein